ncbi:MAG: hypothetical protein JO128_08475 [Alphaproteobacteria bacterium]|nr:hypothetical protein [Alphaproteobacteria bacterium]
MKRCTICGKRKPPSAFYRIYKGRPIRHPQCKSCQDADKRRRHLASRRWIRQYAARWRRKNRGLIDSAKTFLNKRGGQKVRLTNYYRMRHEAILAYGGYRCACCGICEPLFLTIDHVKNDGAHHRRRVGVSATFFRWLKDNGYPKGFQVLCSNCNHGRHRNGGVCPHKDPVGGGRKSRSRRAKSRIPASQTGGACRAVGHPRSLAGRR